MQSDTIISALILGIVEGLTEFIPVSSTGHILLLGHFLGFENTGKIFEVLIQLGAILAILTIYFYRLLSIAKALPTSADARRFVISIVLAFLPAAFAGVFLHSFIKEVLFETPILICIMLILGGFILLWVDRKASKMVPKYTDVERFPLWLCLAIGCCQCVAMIPGVSRSGATIAGSLLMGTNKRSAAEFTFFLAMPTMGGAFAYDLYKNIDHVSFDDLFLVAIGFAAAFVVGAIVVKYLLDFVTKYGFAPFAYWRIAAGFVGLIGLFIYTPQTTSGKAAQSPAHDMAPIMALDIEKKMSKPALIEFQASTPLMSKPLIEGAAETTIKKKTQKPGWELGVKGDPLTR